MKKPDFFLIGAPKCGTTSLAHWLSLHDKIFFSSPKEIFYFCANPNNKSFNTRNKYERVFKKANSSHIAVGEGSTSYLSSKKAIQGILSYQNEAKFIVCLRNPIDMANSMFYMLRYHLLEDQENFENAWALQKERLNGRCIPPGCKFPERLQYGFRCSLGLQMKNLYKLVDRNKVKVVLLDDMKNNTRTVYLDVLGFLNVPDDRRAAFPILNSAKKVNSIKYKIIITRLYYCKRLIIPYNFGLGKYLRGLNEKSIQKDKLSDEFRKELQVYFKEDIELLSDTINRDLGHWLA